jgi:hypothetical protein
MQMFSGGAVAAADMMGPGPGPWPRRTDEEEPPALLEGGRLVVPIRRGAPHVTSITLVRGTVVILLLAVNALTGNLAAAQTPNPDGRFSP